MLSMGKVETIGEYHASFTISGDDARLHVHLTHGFAGPSETSPELLLLHLTARGGIAAGQELSDRLALGRNVIVRTFAEISGKDVRERIWGEETPKR